MYGRVSTAITCEHKSSFGVSCVQDRHGSPGLCLRVETRHVGLRFLVYTIEQITGLISNINALVFRSNSVAAQ